MRKEAVAQNQAQLVTKKNFQFWYHKLLLFHILKSKEEKKQSIILIIMADSNDICQEETATHLWMCFSYHPVPFVTISSNMKDPSSHLGGLIR